MSRLKTALLFITMSSNCSFAQRHGRADSVQNYNSSHRNGNPMLNVRFKSAKTWSYFRLSDLLKMDRVTACVVDPKTHLKNVYEGVALQKIVPGTTNHKVEVFRSGLAFKDHRVLIERALSLQDKLIVADTLNGRRLEISHPFSLIVKDEGGEATVVKHLAYVSLVGAP